MNTRRLRTLQRCCQLAAVLLLCLAANSAHALCTLVCSCSVSTTNVAFGTINPLSAANTDSTGSVRVTCGGVAGLLIPYRVDIGTGGGSYAARRMNSGANTLAYNVYTDTNRTQIWGNGTGGTQYVSNSILLDLLGLSPAQINWVYGRLPGSQTTALPGVYSDTIAVTLTYY